MGEVSKTKQAFWISLGSFSTFALSIVSGMILSRFLSKEDYGTYRQVFYVYTTLLTIFTLGLPKTFSYFLPRVSEAQAKDLIRKITRLFFLLGGVFSALLFVFSGLIAQVMKNPDLELALKIFSPVPLLMLPTMGLEGILATYNRTQFLALYTVSTRLISLVCMIIPVVLLRQGYIEAIEGFVLASVFACVIALKLKYYPLKGVRKEKCAVTYKDIFGFSLPLLKASFWGIIIASADQFFVSRYYGNRVFAEFSNGFMEVPFIGMIVSSCATVLSPVYSRMSSVPNSVSKQEIYELWMRVASKTATLTYPLLFYCLFFADLIMTVLYGNAYASSGGYFQIKVFSGFLNLVLFAPLIINIGKVKEYARIHQFCAILIVILEFMAVHLIQTPYAIAFISIFCQVIKMVFMWQIVSSFLEKKTIKLFPFKLVSIISVIAVLILSLLKCGIAFLPHVNKFCLLFLSFTLYLGGYLLVTFRIIDYSFIWMQFVKRQR